jgi:hypothetical protein
VTICPRFGSQFTPEYTVDGKILNHITNKTVTIKPGQTPKMDKFIENYFHLTKMNKA